MWKSNMQSQEGKMLYLKLRKGGLAFSASFSGSNFKPLMNSLLSGGSCEPERVGYPRSHSQLPGRDEARTRCFDSPSYCRSDFFKWTLAVWICMVVGPRLFFETPRGSAEPLENYANTRHRPGRNLGQACLNKVKDEISGKHIN